MGKPKAKKSKQAAESGSVAGKDDLTADSPSQINAIDGHNTQGWTNTEIRAYNDLIVERQRLEKQRNQLEEKCAKSQTQRALLHENIASIDSMFKSQKPTSVLLKYTGSSACCMDMDLNLSQCHHELCHRAKGEGITDTELDTVKYYAMRMYTEKSDRVRNALRKQRDVELDRVRKEEQEEQSHNARKSAKKPKTAYADMPKSGARGSRGKEVTKAAKETEKIVNKIINQLDDLRTDLQAGRISAEEAQGKLDLLDRNLPLGHGRPSRSKSAHDDKTGLSSQDIDLTKQTLQSDLRERLLGAKGDTFSQAFSIMDHFLSATKPGDLQDAISELKDVLQLAGPMCDDLQKSLGALEGIFDNPERLAFTGPDGKQECSSSIIELMGKLKDNLKRTGQLPDGANASLTKVFQDCIDLEEDAKTRMVKQASSSALSTNEIQKLLVEIKDECVAKSPIPPLTSNKLDSDIAALLDIHDAHRLLTKTRSGATSQELGAQITAQVISRTPRKPEMYVETLKRLQIACHQVGGEGYPQLLDTSLSMVLEKMSNFKPQPQIQKEDQVTSNTSQEKVIPKISQSATDSERPKSSISGAVPTISKLDTHVATQVLTTSGETQDIRKLVRERVRTCETGELWDTFELYHCDTTFEADLAMFDKVLNFKDETRAIIEDKAGGIEAAVTHLFSRQLCPAFSATLIAQALWDVVDRPGRDVKPYIKQLARCIDSSFSAIPEEWISIFRHLVLAMMQLYVASFVEVTAILSEISATHFAVFTITIFTTFVHLTRTASQAFENLAVMTNFVFACFDQDPADSNSILDSALVHYGHFCRSDQFKCMTSLSCSNHMPLLRNRATGTFSERDGDSMVKIKRSAAGSQASKSSGYSIKQPRLSAPSENDFTEQKLHGADSQPGLEGRYCYRSDEHPERKRIHHTRTRDARLAECLRKAAVLHESTARKALALLQLRADEYESQKLLPPTELVVALDELLNVAEDSYHHHVSYGTDSNPDRKFVHSRFAEHLDEPLPYHKRSMQTILAIQNVFKMLRTGSLGTAYLNDFIDRMKLLAMSGQFSSPIQFVDQHRANLARIGKLPEPFAQALVRTQNELYAELELPDVKYAFKTKRLKCLLAMVGAGTPDSFALLRLITYKPKGLEEYIGIISDRYQETDDFSFLELDGLWYQVTQLDAAGSLNQDSPVLSQITDYLIRDWSQRPTEITKYDYNDVDQQYSRFGTDDNRAHSLTKDNYSPAIAESPAKQPKVESGHSMNLAVATKASILSPARSETPIKSSAAQKDTQDIQRASTFQNTRQISNFGSQRMNNTVSQQQIGEALAEHRLLNGHSFNDVSSAEPQTKLMSTSNHRLQYTRPHSADLMEVSTGAYQASDRDSTRAKYLSLSSNANFATKELSADEDALLLKSSSVPTSSFRQLDMAKRLASLQANSRDLAETAKSVTNADHARVFDGLANKLQGFVAGLAESVDKLANLKGIQIAGFEPPSGIDG